MVTVRAVAAAVLAAVVAVVVLTAAAACASCCCCRCLLAADVCQHLRHACAVLVGVSQRSTHMHTFAQPSHYQQAVTSTDATPTAKHTHLQRPRQQLLGACVFWLQREQPHGRQRHAAPLLPACCDLCVQLQSWCAVGGRPRLAQDVSEQVLCRLGVCAAARVCCCGPTHVRLHLVG
jgi:hypothetical protein